MISGINTHNIVFLGQTGFGKSSLINILFGSHFNTDPLVSCTKELYSVTTIRKSEEEGERLVTVYDTPGIGEFSNNSIYQSYYNLAAALADHIVLVVTLDRTDSTSQDLLASLKPFLKSNSVKFTIALNRIDSNGVKNETNYNSWDVENNTPSNECLRKIEKRLVTIKENYEDADFLPFEIIPVSAIRNYGIKELRERILK